MEKIAGKYHIAWEISDFVMQWEIFLETPLVDETGLTNRFDDLCDWHTKTGLRTGTNFDYYANTTLLRKDLLEQALGTDPNQPAR